MKTIKLRCSTCNQLFRRSLADHNKNLARKRINFYCGITCRQQALVKYTEENGYRFKKGYHSPTQFKKGHKHSHIVRGEDSNASLLTNQNVLDIRQKWRDGITVKEICNWSGMSETAIRSIIKYKTWKHLP